ncbi:tetraacyldisaccharide 4'-kinase [Undibacterium terreum]|uniref:Tetraacyldisaccharide 4'-kinase n=1 Tax=Undibacterium terreum TaxID=1224302 RepID=A0A916UHR5_9BURK|nr:tetraacyldisaccharide 4'-kinase [Undibacterium terreum]GGC73333.1 tetraacyldisaccharide 4'-kinase [Undibacterium terreum]
MRAWLRRGLTARLLWPFSKLFQILVTFRFGLFLMGYKRQTRLPVPVVVVGNTFVGGTGKTPLTIWLAQQLRLAGRTPGVISRGYGSDAGAVTEVTSDALASQVGDEPLLIAQRAACPVMVGRNRVAAAQALLQKYPQTDIIISDDGLQHYALARDVEIILFDQRGVGNGWMLPAGPLREPAQRRSDFTVLNMSGAKPGVAAPGVPADALAMQLLAEQVVSLANPAFSMPLSDLAADAKTNGKANAKTIVAAAGIGNPERFFAMLRAAGVHMQTLPLQDHYDFADNPFQTVQADMILITEKDAVKCRQIKSLQQDARLWVVPVSAQLDAGFAVKLMEKISEKQNGRSLA